MASNVGIPAVPSGLPRDLSMFLQAMAENVRILAGSARGAHTARAVREYERGTGTASIGHGAIGQEQLQPRAVTTAKLADGAVTADKLAVNAVTERSIKPGAVSADSLALDAVTGDKIAFRTISADKMAVGVIPDVPALPVVVAGQAVAGEIVLIPGVFTDAPVVCVTAIHALEASSDAAVLVGPLELAEVIEDEGQRTGKWQFTAAGAFAWVAVGYEP